jgi:anthranilate phosphoribosyltransferase
MGQTFELIGANALLLRGTEGEVVADARRTPQMEAFVGGQRTLLQEFQPGTLASVPDLPTEIDSDSTAAYIRAVMSGSHAVPASIARQVEHILRLTLQLSSQP